MGQRVLPGPARLAPGRARQFEHPAQQPGRRPPAHQDAPGAVLDQEMHPVAGRTGGLRRLARQGLGDPGGLGCAAIPPGAESAGRALRRADGGPEVEQRLGEVARPRAGGGLLHPALRQRIQLALGPRQRRGLGMDAGGDALDIAIGRHDRDAEGDRGDRGGGIGADPGDLPQILQRVGEAVQRGQRLRARMQVPRSGVVAKPRPFLRHLLPRRAGQGVDIGEPGQEARVAGGDGGNRGLLEHDFGQPDPVRVGLACGIPPGQRPLVAVVPGEQG